MARYHINPYTGTPAICHAKYGKCPYGGQTGNENHFDSYEAAQAKSDEIHAQQFQQTQDLEYNARNRDWKAFRKYDYLEDMSRQEAMDEILTTNDSELIKSVLNGEVLSEEEDYFSTAALSNGVTPRFVRDSIIDEPGQYSKEALLSFAENPRLTSYEIIELTKGYPNDSMFVDDILKNPRIESTAITKILDDFEQGKSTYPNMITRIVNNPNCPKEYYNRWVNTPELFKLMKYHTYQDIYDN